MGSTRPPVGPALFPHLRRVPRRQFRFRRFPEPAAREPFENDVLVGAAELMKRRQEIILRLRPERGRLLIDQDRPVNVAGRHGSHFSPATVFAPPALGRVSPESANV